MLKSKDVENVEQFQLNLILKTDFVLFCGIVSGNIS